MFADFDGKPLRHRLHRWMASRLARHDVRLTSVDTPGALQAERLLGIPHEQFAVIPNGVAADEMEPAKGWAGEGVFHLGYLGHLEERKGWQIGAQAALDLQSRGKRVRYIIAGEGPETDQARAWQRKHPGVIEYLGHVSQPRRNFLSKLHALSLMSSSEGLPMSIIEALSVRLPVITTRVGGIAEAFTDGVNGLFVSRDSESLVNAVLRLYNRPDEHTRVGTEGFRLFLKSFELKRIVREYDNLYLQSLQGPSSCARDSHGLRDGVTTLSDQ